MEGRAFLDTARNLAQGSTEADWRTAAGRAYYALFHECRKALEAWGFTNTRKDQAHAFVRLRLVYPAHTDLRSLGYALENLNNLRNHADYKLDVQGPFATGTSAQAAATLAQDRIDLLDAINGDPVRRDEAIAAILTAFPPPPPPPP